MSHNSRIQILFKFPSTVKQHTLGHIQGRKTRCENSMALKVLKSYRVYPLSTVSTWVFMMWNESQDEFFFPKWVTGGPGPFAESIPPLLCRASQLQVRCPCVRAGLHLHGRMRGLLFRAGSPRQAGQSHDRRPVRVWAGPHPCLGCVPGPAPLPQVLEPRKESGCLLVKPSTVFFKTILRVLRLCIFM